MRPGLDRPFGLTDVVAAIAVAGAWILLASCLREPTRQRFNAILVAGAGAAYLGGGLGWWEVAFISVSAYVAYRGLASYRFIGLAWLMHACWDVMHHLYGTPIIPMVATSSAQCGVCDVLIATWFFAGAPSVLAVFRRRVAAT